MQILNYLMILGGPSLSAFALGNQNQLLLT